MGTPTGNATVVIPQTLHWPRADEAEKRDEDGDAWEGGTLAMASKKAGKKPTNEASDVVTSELEVEWRRPYL